MRDTFVPLHMVFHLFGMSFLHFHIENSYTPYEAQLEFTPVWNLPRVSQAESVLTFPCSYSILLTCILHKEPTSPTLVR